MNSVLLSHPHAKADMQGFAAALDEAGLLGRVFTGLAAARGSLSAGCLALAGRLAPSLRNRIVPGISASRLRSLAAVELSVRALAQLARWTGAKNWSCYDRMYVAHDTAVALCRWPRSIDGVYAYEDGALRTFLRAARKGIPRVYDLPTPHYATVERIRLEEFARWPDATSGPPPIEPDWRKRRKDGELAAATHICVASEFTRESLDAIGCSLPVRVVPYGFPVESFAAKQAPPSGPFTVLAVGGHNLRKGTPYLLEAWKRAGVRQGRLRLIGPMQLSDRFLERYRDCFEHVPHLPKAALANEYRAADALAFPTLADGFGLVIQEAMCCGTPVLTTRCGGGPECIVSGQIGWLVPERDTDALAYRLREMAADRQTVFEIGRAARRRAEDYTWKEAGGAMVEFLAGIGDPP